ncbi:WD40 repeat domain-containing protein [archaeon]|nr:MAG: WD40 repeat domain-containing protein [archaeon]
MRLQIIVCRADSGDTVRDIALTDGQPTCVYICTALGRVVCANMLTGVQSAVTTFPGIIVPRKAAVDSADYGLYAIAVNAGADLMAVSCVSRIYFFDLRGGAAKLLSTYVSSHMEAVTQLAFHPVIPHHLVSGGDDGLVCVFDLTVRTEDDALVVVFNAESAVSRFGFFGDSGAFVWIITRTETLSLWNIGSAERLGNFNSLRMTFMEADLPLDSLLECTYDASTSRLTLLAADFEGGAYACDVTPAAFSVQSHMSLGHVEAPIRCLAFAHVLSAHSSSLVVYSGGEDGLLTQCVVGDATALAAYAAAAIPESAAAAASPFPAATSMAVGTARAGAGAGGALRAGRWQRAHVYERNAMATKYGMQSEAATFGCRDVKALRSAYVGGGSGAAAGTGKKSAFVKDESDDE